MSDASRAVLVSCGCLEGDSGGGGEGGAVAFVDIEGERVSIGRLALFNNRGAAERKTLDEVAVPPLHIHVYSNIRFLVLSPCDRARVRTQLTAAGAIKDANRPCPPLCHSRAIGIISSRFF